MSKVIVEKISDYDNVLIIDKDSNNGTSIYNKLINTLKSHNIIDTNYNKLQILKDNICIVYNINNFNGYEDIEMFKEIYENKLNKHSILLLTLNKYNNKIIDINGVIVCHSKLIKQLMKLPQFNDVINEVIRYNISVDNLKYYVNEIIRLLLISIIHENKLNNNCFKYVKDRIKWFIEKDSKHDNKVNSVSYLDKTVVVLDYKSEHKQYSLNNNNGIFTYTIK